MQREKRTVIIFRSRDDSTLEYYVKKLEENYDATDVKILPFINGISCLLKGEHLYALDADGDIEAVEEDLTLTLPPFYEEKGTSWWYLRWKFPKWDENHQIIPLGVERIGARRVWERTTGKEVKVAVLDTGIDINHPDLKINVAEGINLVSPGVVPEDDHGHGTHIAGIIAAADNSSGVIGVSPAAQLYPVKVLNSRGEGTLTHILEGLQWCVDNGIQVINMSFGTDSHSVALEKAITVVHRAGIVMVAAAGNDGTNFSVDFPAAYHQTVAVGAVTSGDRLAWYSSRGSEITLVAPGDRVLSTIRGGRYGRLSGTSMATAHVTGAVALLLQMKPELEPWQVIKILTGSAEKLRRLKENQQGAGLVRADKCIHCNTGAFFF
jgi:subtilisin